MSVPFAVASALFAVAALAAMIAWRRLASQKRSLGEVERSRLSLLERIEESESERRLLASIVGGMKEGLVVLGPDRRIRLANDAFRQIFDIAADPSGRLLAEVARHPGILEPVEAAIEGGGEPVDSTIESTASGRVFEMRVAPLGAGGTHRTAGAIVLFFDVTRLEALERVRREFVADVSHELRTPLTSIKAFVETILEEQLRDRDGALRFLEIVAKHVRRMEALIDDLTDLSLIETGAVTLDRSRFDAAEVARDVASQLAPRAIDRGVAIRVDMPSPLSVFADRRRLEQILLNLVDNAIKFNRPGGYVRITAEATGGKVRLAVEDSGVGIAADARERVFNRFFRVDPARSRDLGGTGLGLAIVKHLARLHGGSVHLDSEMGKGSRFWVELPSEDSTGGGGPP